MIRYTKLKSTNQQNLIKRAAAKKHFMVLSEPFLSEKMPAEYEEDSDRFIEM